MDAAVHAARHALPHWRALPANQRRDMMLRLCQLVKENAEQLARLQTIENAVPRMFASRFPEAAVDYLAYNAGWIDKIGGEVVTTWPTRAIDFTLDEPYGVVALFHGTHRSHPWAKCWARLLPQVIPWLLSLLNWRRSLLCALASWFWNPVSLRELSTWCLQGPWEGTP